MNANEQISPFVDRRGFLSWATAGLGSVALLSLLDREACRASTPADSRERPPHHPPRARRAIQICACGGMSQVDTFDYKPELIKRDGQPLPGAKNLGRVD